MALEKITLIITMKIWSVHSLNLHCTSSKAKQGMANVTEWPQEKKQNTCNIHCDHEVFKNGKVGIKMDLISDDQGKTKKKGLLRNSYQYNCIWKIKPIRRTVKLSSEDSV